MKARRYEETARAFITVRKAIGMSQQKIADALGISKATVENIEGARAPIRAELAERIGALAGVAPWTLESGDPRDFQNAPYTAASLKEWQNLGLGQQEFDQLCKMAFDYLRVLLEAAVSKDHLFRPCLRSVLIDFNRFIFEQVKAHRLDDTVAALLLRRHSTVSRGRQMTVAEAQKRFGKSNEWQEHYRREWKPDAKVNYTFVSVPRFVPFVGFGQLPDGTAVFYQGRSAALHIYQLRVEGSRFKVVAERENAGVALAAGEFRKQELRAMAGSGKTPAPQKIAQRQKGERASKRPAARPSRRRKCGA